MIKDIQSTENLAEQLSEEELASIGMQVFKNYEIDKRSLADWQNTVDNAMEIAKQTIEVKNEPWENASNVKYPLITKAAIEFAARLYPEFVQDNRVVKASVVGADPDNSKRIRAQKVSTHMSYQLLNQCEGWEDGVDSLFHVLPVLGTVFRKVYYDPMIKQPVSEFCPPDKIIVNYNTPSLEQARRITHIVSMSSSEVLGRMRKGLYLDSDIKEICANDGVVEDDDPLLTLLEQHCYLDLDDDDYKEPYIVTIQKSTQKVFSIYSRIESVEKNKEDKIVKIVPEHYFTDYHFIKSPDGGFYSIGLGSLLYPLNAAINTLNNQLIDAGTLSNTQSGFLGRGLRLKNGEFKVKRGTWKVLDAASGTDISKNVVPLPTKEPSSVLFQLLGMLIDVGKDLIAASDLMQGKGETQNVSPNTVLAMIKQGMKIHAGIAKRVYRSFSKELKKIYKLNEKYLTNKEYRRILNDETAEVKVDYDCADLDVFPVADPSMSSDVERMVKASALREVPGINMYEAGKYYLETLQFSAPEIERLLPAPNPEAPPPAEEQKDLAQAELFKAQALELQTRAQVQGVTVQLEAKRVENETNDSITRAHLAAANTMKSNNAISLDQHKAALNEAKVQHKVQIDNLKLMHQADKDNVQNQLAEADLVTSHMQKTEQLALKDKELNIKAKEGRNEQDRED